MKKLLFLFILLLLIPSCNKNIEENKTNLKQKNSDTTSNINENIQSPTQNNTIDNTFKRFLEEPDTIPNNILIKIYKGKRILKLFGDNNLIATFKIALGSSPEGDKYKEGDRRTPEGNYYVCTRNDKSQFTLFLGLSYPNIDDAKTALNKEIITQKQFDNIKKAIEKGKTPDWYTILGGEVGIHGGGNSKDWNWGCIALSDEDIKILWKYTKLQTPVEIYK